MQKVIRINEVATRTGLPVVHVRQYIRDGIIKSAQPCGKGTAIWVLESEADRLAALLRGGK